MPDLICRKFLIVYSKAEISLKVLNVKGTNPCLAAHICECIRVCGLQISYLAEYILNKLKL